MSSDGGAVPVAEEPGAWGAGPPVAEEGQPLRDVVCILGQTGAGKSKLAVELALAVDGEVVNCDAMQVYEGLPIATAQIPEQEQRGVPHHMLGVVHPSSARGADTEDAGITVREFRDMALPIVEDVLARGKVPLLVGGSDYYLRALVSRALLDDQTRGGSEPAGTLDEERVEDADADADAGDDDDVSAEPTSTAAVEDAQAAHDRLRAVDPASAAKIHPNNTRRVRRYLEIFDATGTPASEVFAAGVDCEMRYRCLFFAMRADDGELELALRRRVDGMVAAGLVHELERAAATTAAGDARGAGQSIGFHEWGAYLRARGFDWVGGTHRDGRSSAEKQERRCVDLDALRRDAVEATKADTCRLARRQARRCARLERAFGWRLRFLDSTATHRALRANDAAAAAAAWATDVFDPALAAAKTFLAGSTPENSAPNGEFGEDGGKRRRGDGGVSAARDATEWREYRCDVCDRTVRGEVERRAHFQGRRHLKRAAAARKRARGGHGARAPGFGGDAPDAPIRESSELEG
jgi:tRNA dimethylallyltransferase